MKRVIIAICLAGFLVGFAGCRRKPACNMDQWNWGSIAILGGGGYAHIGIGFEIPSGMTEEQVQHCIYNYLVKNVGKDNTLLDRDSSHETLKDGMREIDYWAIVYAQLLDRDLKIPAWFGWGKRDEMIRELLEMQ